MQRLLATLVASCIVSGTMVFGSDDSQRTNLVGLSGVEVQVLGVDADLGPISKETVRTAVEARLRQAGIRVIERNKTEFVYLYINLTATPDEEHSFVAFATSLDLYEVVKLERDPSRVLPVFAATWNHSIVGIAGNRRLDVVMGSVRAVTDEFVNDYLAANPKK